MPASPWTRRRFLGTAGSAGVAAGGLAALGYATYRPGHAPAVPRVDSGALGVQSFFSRPDLSPPAVQFAGPRRSRSGASSSRTGRAAGSRALLIVDTRGDVAWIWPGPPGKRVMGFRTQAYHGQTVLTWWEGTVTSAGYGRGQGVIADRPTAACTPSARAVAWTPTCTSSSSPRRARRSSPPTGPPRPTCPGWAARPAASCWPEWSRRSTWPPAGCCSTGTAWTMCR